MTTILHITDPHLMSDRQGELKGVPTAKTLAAVLAKAREVCSEPQYVIWTGDLSHEETVAGYQLLDELVGDWMDRSQLLPGNHDDRTALRKVFDHVEGAGQEPVSFQVEVEKWRLVGLDTQIPGEVAGALSEEQMVQLDGDLATDPTRPTLIFMHHPPIPVGCPWLDEIGLRDPHRLQQLLLRYPGVRGVFCGHVHLAHEGTLAHARVFCSPSAALQFDRDNSRVAFDMIPPGFRLIKLNGESFSTELVRCADLNYPPRED